MSVRTKNNHYVIKKNKPINLRVLTMYSFIFVNPESKNITAQPTPKSELEELLDEMAEMEDEQELDFN